MSTASPPPPPPDGRSPQPLPPFTPVPTAQPPPPFTPVPTAQPPPPLAPVSSAQPPPPAAPAPAPQPPPPTAQAAPGSRSAPIVLHGFKRGRRPFSVVVLADALVVVQTSPGFRGLGAMFTVLVSGSRQRRLDRVAPQGVAAVQADFPHGDVIGIHELAGVQVSTALLGQRRVVLHRLGGYEPTSLPFPRKKLPLAELHAAFAPRVGPRFTVDPDVAAVG